MRPRPQLLRGQGQVFGPRGRGRDEDLTSLVVCAAHAQNEWLIYLALFSIKAVARLLVCACPVYHCVICVYAIRSSDRNLPINTYLPTLLTSGVETDLIFDS